MFTRNLALSVASAVLLSASALPAMAANPPLFFDFTTTYSTPLASPPIVLTGRLTTNDAGLITGGLNFKLFNTLTSVVTPVTITTTPSGSYTSTPNTTGFNPATTYAITNLLYGINPAGVGGLVNPTETRRVINPTILAQLGPSGGPNTFWLQTSVRTGGPPPAPTTTTQNYQTAAFTALPEINGGVLPKALFVVAGAFLMFFGRNKRVEA